jgi:hypothetical protein
LNFGAVCVHYRVFNIHLQIIFQIYDWRPEFYNDTNDLPEKMPRHLKEYIIAQKKINPLRVSEVTFSLTCLALNLGTESA